MEQKDCPRISVIVPVYKVEAYLDRCVTSILNQTFQDFEVILVDDGSPDRCPQLCDQWAERDSRIRVIHRENGGQSSARNAGLAVAAGQYISFVDSDDWIEPEMFQHLYMLLTSHPTAQMAQCGMVMDREEKYITRQPQEALHEMDRKEMLDYFFRIHGEASNDSIWNRLYDRSVLAGFSFVDKKHEDVIACYDFFQRAERMVVTNQVFYHYFQNPEGVTASFSLSDLGYLDVWDDIVARTAGERPDYLFYAEMGRKRANFTLLAKMKLRGYDKGDDALRNAARDLKKQVRQDFWALLRWKMPLSRKALLVLLCL